MYNDQGNYKGWTNQTTTDLDPLKSIGYLPPPSRSGSPHGTRRVELVPPNVNCEAEGIPVEELSSLVYLSGLSSGESPWFLGFFHSIVRGPRSDPEFASRRRNIGNLNEYG